MLSTFPHAILRSSHDADEAMGRSRAAFYSRFLVSSRSPRSMSFASAGGAISVTIRADHNTERAHPPARGFASRRDRLRHREFLQIKRRVISPNRKQDATEATRQGDHRNAAAAPSGETVDPRA